MISDFNTVYSSLVYMYIHDFLFDVLDVPVLTSDDLIPILVSVVHFDLILTSLIPIECFSWVQNIESKLLSVERFKGIMLLAKGTFIVLIYI